MSETYERKPLGEVIDGLGLTMSLIEGDLISDVLVIAKVIEADGQVRMTTAWSPSGDWITRLGLITAVAELELPKPPGECTCP